MNGATLALNESHKDLEEFERLMKRTFDTGATHRSSVPLYSTPSPYHHHSYYYNPYRTPVYSPYYTGSLSTSRYGPYNYYSPYYRSSGMASGTLDTLPDYYYYGNAYGRPYGQGYYDPLISGYDWYPSRYQTLYVR